MRGRTQYFTRYWVSLAAAIFSTTLAPSSAAQPAHRVVIAAVGDISLARGIATSKRSENVFGGIRPLLSGADVMFGNLECAVSSSPTRRKLPVTLRANPKAVAAFTGLPPLVLSVANNHSLDCGAQGLTDTIASLRSEGIHAVGGGPSLADAQRPVIMPVNGLRIAVVAFSEFSAIRQVPGATISPATVPSVRETVSRAAKQADVVVASFHWGIEGQQTPTDHQRALARAAVASGAILVIGSHPHVLQGLEWLPARHGRRALVAYSLGNFVFDSRRQEMNRTAILRVTFERNSIKLAEFVPVVIQHGCPHPATPDEAARILTLVSHFSSKFGAKVNGTGELKSLR